MQRAQKTAKAHVKQSAKEQEARKKAAKNKRPIEEAKEESKEEAVPVQDTHTVWEPQEIEEAEWDNDPEQENAEAEGFVDESGEETLQECEEYSDEDDWGDEILEDDWDEE